MSMETNVNRFIGGIDRDSSTMTRTGVSTVNPTGSSTYDNSYLDAVGWVDNSETNDGYLTSEIGDSLIPLLGSTEFHTLGSCVEGEFIYLFILTVENTPVNYIIQVHRVTNAVKIISNSSLLNFNIDYGIKAVARRLYNKDLALYFTDNNNPVWYLTCDDSGVVVPSLIVPEQLMTNIKDVSLDYTIKSNGGAIPCGGICLGIAFVSEDGAVLQYSKSTKTILIADDSDGGYNSLTSSKSVSLDIIFPDSKPRFIQLYAITSVGDLNVITANLVGKPKYVTTPNTTILYTGYETTELISIDDISVGLAYYRKAKCIDVINNRLVMANLSETEFDISDYVFEEAAKFIKFGVVFVGVSKDSIRTGAGNLEAGQKLQETLRSYKRNEVYAMSYSVITDDGVEYGPYHIPANVGDVNNAPITTDTQGNLGKYVSQTAPEFLGTYYSDIYYSPDSAYYTIPDAVDKVGRIRHHVIPNVEEIMSGSDVDVFVPRITVLGITNMITSIHNSLGVNETFTNKIADVKIYRGIRSSNRDKTIVSQGIAHPCEKPHLYYTSQNGQVTMSKSVIGNLSLSVVQPTYDNQAVECFQLDNTAPVYNRPSDVMSSWMSGTMKVNTSNPIVGIDPNGAIDQFVNYYSPETTFSRLDIGDYRMVFTELLTGVMTAWDNDIGDNSREPFWRNLTSEQGNTPNIGIVGPGATVISHVIIDYKSSLLIDPIKRKIHNNNSFYADTFLKRDLQGDFGSYGKTDVEQNTQVFQVDSLALPDDSAWDSGVVFRPLPVAQTGVSYVALGGTGNTVAKTYRAEIESFNRACYGDLGDITYTEVYAGLKSVDSAVFYKGDTYTSFFGYRNSCTYFGAAPGVKTYNIGITLSSLFVESTFNCQLRHTLVSNEGGYTVGGLPYYDRDTLRNLIGYNIVDNSGTYNTSYSVEYLTKPKFTIPSFITRVVEFPNRVIYSELSLEGSTVDKFRIFKVNNYKDFQNNRGAIWDIFVMVGELFIHCLQSLFKTNMETSTAIQSTTGNEIVLGTAGLFATPATEIVTLDGGYGGVQDSYVGVTTPSGRMFADKSSGSVFLFNGKTLTNVGVGLMHFFRNTLGLGGNFDNPFNNDKGGLVGGYDYRNNRYLLTKKDGSGFGNGNPSFTASFSFNNNRWISRHVYIPSHYVSSANSFYSSSLNGFYKHNVGEVSKFRNANSYSLIRFKMADNPTIPKVLDSCTLYMRCYDYATGLFQYRTNTTDNVLLETENAPNQSVFNTLNYSTAWYIAPAPAGTTNVRIVNNRYQFKAPFNIKPDVLSSERLRALNHNITLAFNRQGNQVVKLEAVETKFRHSIR